jgi:hypothetical protein
LENSLASLNPAIDYFYMLRMSSRAWEKRRNKEEMLQGMKDTKSSMQLAACPFSSNSADETKMA